jgi:hypothetical protein
LQPDEFAAPALGDNHHVDEPDDVEVPQAPELGQDVALEIQVVEPDHGDLDRPICLRSERDSATPR